MHYLNRSSSAISTLAQISSWSRIHFTGTLLCFLHIDELSTMEAKKWVEYRPYLPGSSCLFRLDRSHSRGCGSSGRTPAGQTQGLEEFKPANKQTKKPLLNKSGTSHRSAIPASLSPKPGWHIGSLMPPWQSGDWICSEQRNGSMAPQTSSPRALEG
jgi:hypothetical protein